MGTVTKIPASKKTTYSTFDAKFEAEVNALPAKRTTEQKKLAVLPSNESSKSTINDGCITETTRKKEYEGYKTFEERQLDEVAALGGRR